VDFFVQTPSADFDLEYCFGSTYIVHWSRHTTAEILFSSSLCFLLMPITSHFVAFPWPISMVTRCSIPWSYLPRISALNSVKMLSLCYFLLQRSHATFHRSDPLLTFAFPNDRPIRHAKEPHEEQLKNVRVAKKKLSAPALLRAIGSV